MEKDIVIKLTEKYKKSERFILLLIKMCKDCNIENKEEMIEKFIKKVISVSKSVSKKYPAKGNKAK